MSSDDDEFLAVAQFDKSTSKLAASKAANSSDDDVPIFNFNKSVAKPKMKSFSFASKLSTIIQPTNSDEEKPIVPTVLAPIPVSISMLGQQKKKLLTLKQLSPLSPVSTNVVHNINPNNKRDRSPGFNEPVVADNFEEVKSAPAKKMRTETSSAVASEPVKYKYLVSGFEILHADDTGRLIEVYLKKTYRKREYASTEHEMLQGAW